VLVSHFTLHAPQVSVDVREVSQPSVSGAVVRQSAQPVAQLYVHVVPVQPTAVALVVLHCFPQAEQLVVDDSEVSQPSVSGAVVSQSAQPAVQLVYWQVVPSQVAPVLRVLLQAAPHVVQFETVFSAVLQPERSGAAGLQSPHPEAHA
jgi:hypothetical protein